MNTSTTHIFLPIPNTFTSFNGRPRNPLLHNFQQTITKTTKSLIQMRDRSKNRKPLQKGRNLSIEAIQTVQNLKRTKSSNNHIMLEQAFQTSFRRLLKSDMIAVFRELIRQNECYLALKVFDDMRKEFWYKPKLPFYAEMVAVLGSNGLVEEIEIVFAKLKEEKNGLGADDINGFNLLLESLMNFNLTGLAMECFHLMKSLGCDPDRVSFKILVTSLKSNGEVELLLIVHQEAKKLYGYDLEFLDEVGENTMSSDRVY